MLDFAECEQLVTTARDKRSKPVQNNTRVEKRDSDTYALRLHATDIATFHRDGRIIVNTGGWRTVTTLERLRGWVTREIVSEQGQWFVRCEPNPADPEPPRGERTVLKPFHALDPGPEPVKPAEGCLAGTERVEVETRRVWIREGEHQDSDVTIEHSDGYFSALVERDVSVLTRYFERVPYRHTTEYEQELLAARERVGDVPEIKFERCPHCKLFDAQHDAWREAMHGGGWGRNRTHGYAKMVENLERYESREAWQQAYIADFRAAREARKVYKEWVAGNRVPFEDGMELTANGYAKRPDVKAIARAQRERKRVDRKRERINKFVADAVKELTTNGVPMPSNGDCFGCLFRAEDRAIEPLGVDHLEQHIEERYYVPSMYVNAMRTAGYRDEGIYMMLGMDADAKRMGGPERAQRISSESVTRALRRYLYDRLIPEISQHPVAA